MVENKRLYPGFSYPAQFFSKLQCLVIWQYARITHTKVHFYMIEAYLLCRIVTAIIGTLTIVVIFLIGNYLYKRVGTVSAFFMALSPMMVNMSKQVTGDVTALFLAALVMLFALRYTEECKTKYIVIMSVLSAMATMEKWHGGGSAAFIGIIILLYASSIKEFVKCGIIALFTYIISIVVIAPNLAINAKNAISDFFCSAVWDGGAENDYFANMHSYIDGSFLGFGITLISITVLGLILVIIRKDKRWTVLLLGLIKVMMLSFMNRAMPRWGLELYFSQIIIASYAICFLMEKQSLWTKGIAYVAVGILSIETMLSVAFVDVIATADDQDIRCLQEQFCYENGIGKDDSISSRYTAFVPGGIRADAEGEVVSEDCDNMFLIDEQKIYKLQDFDYYIWSNRYNVSDIKSILDKDDLCIWSKKVDYADVFNRAWCNAGRRAQATRNDFLICKDYIDAIKNVNNGAVIGAYDIGVYDISSIPLYYEVKQEQ